MKISINDLPNCLKELILTIDNEEALQEYNKVMRQFKNYVVIPGFRKGKAPLNMVERVYGDHIKEEFYNQKLNEFYKTAIDEKEQKPITQGELKDVQWEKGKDLIATFSFEVMPEVKIENYKGLEVPFEEVKFQPEMIDDTLEDFQRKLAAEETAETAETGNFITVQVKFLDDEENVTKQVDRKFILGENSYSLEFNEKLLGTRVGDEFKTKLFAKDDDSTDEEITPEIKDREFLVEITGINRVVLPELNDDFAKDLECDTLQILKDKIKEDLLNRLNKENRETKENSIVNALIQANPFEMPRSIIQSQAAEMAKPYIEKYKYPPEQIIPIYETFAEHNLKRHLILAEIKKIEKIEITDEDKENAIKEAAENMKMEPEQYREMYKKQIESDDFKYTLEDRKLMELLENYSKFVPYHKEDKKEKEEK